MHRISAFVSAAALLVLVVPIAGQQQIKISTMTVPVYVTVLDQTKRLVPDLQQDDFEVLDNGKPQTLDIFENKPTPITTMVMLDTSGSMTTALDLVKDGAEQFLLRLLPEDQGAGRRVQRQDRVPSGTDVHERSRRAGAVSEEDLDFGYPTRLYDASTRASRSSRTRRPKVVLVFTDGDDTASKIGLGKVMDRAREKDVMVYAIGLVNEYFNGQQRVRSQPDRGLKKLAEETGGGYFELKRTADLNETFTRVAQELHSQYVLGFSPEALDGKSPQTRSAREEGRA